MNTARLAPALFLLAATLGCSSVAWASEPAPAKSAKTLSAKVMQEDAHATPASAAVDPLEQLRQRLAERLAGQKANASGSQRDVVVVAKPAKAASPTATPTPTPTHAAAPARKAVAAPVPAATPSGGTAKVATEPPTPVVAHSPAADQGRTVVPGSTRGVVPVAAHLVLPPVLATPPAALADPHAAVPETAPAPAARAARARPAAPKAATPHGGAAHWDYNGPAGPQTWGGLKPEFSLCGSGQRQSPIDIRGGLAVDLEPVRFDYQSSRFSVIDNGHTVQANVAPGNAIELGGNRFELQQFHFHRPSEERIDGRQFEMSLHLVHRDTQGRLAVVTLLLEKGQPQPAVQKVWNNLPLEKNQDVPARVALDLNELLPADSRYYTYMGSLTTPPCTEGVQWVVMRQPVTVAPEQIELFARIYPMNARPVQQASGRRIMQSN